LDAELAYRHQQIRSDFRPWRRTARRPGDAGAPVAASRNAAGSVGVTAPLRAVETARAVGVSTSGQQATQSRQIRAA